MDRITAQKIFFDYSSAVAYVDTESQEGDRRIGSAFHVGEGVFVTARHCVQDSAIREVKITEPVLITYKELEPGMPPDFSYEEYDAAGEGVLGRKAMYKHWLAPLDVVEGPIFHENENVDLAVFKVRDIHHAVPIIKLGGHWDDWVYRRLWVMGSAIILGYPPIPMTLEPTLVAAKGEVHTYVQLRHSPHIHFVLSSTARGGFSGGPAIYEDGYALGVVTSSLVRNGLPAEMGFQAVLSIEPIRGLLESSGLLPPCQKKIFESPMRKAKGSE